MEPGRSSRVRSRVLLTAALVSVAALQVAGTYAIARDVADARPIDAVTLALLVAGPLLVLALWTRPVVSLAAVMAVSVGYFAVGAPYGPFVMAPLIALVNAGAKGHRVAGWVTGAAAVVAIQLLHLFNPHPQGMDWRNLIEVMTWGSIGLVASQLVRSGRERRQQAAMTKAEQARRRASEERLRIARELHDVLAHDISLINVQASVGLKLMDSQPEQARESLTVIKHASKDALEELRSALELLRTGERPPRAPAGGVGAIDDLATRLSTPNLEVRVRRTGEQRGLDAAVELAAFRIVQEALTNVVRHARGATTATVDIHYLDRDLKVIITDDGGQLRSGRPAGADDGSGITGMTERASALGGTLHAGALPGGGFEVTARLPLTPSVDASGSSVGTHP